MIGRGLGLIGKGPVQAAVLAVIKSRIAEAEEDFLAGQAEILQKAKVEEGLLLRHLAEKVLKGE